MTKEELNLVLHEGGGYKIEFKENIYGLDKEIVAFANASGDRIFIGVTDDRKIKGITISNELKSQIQDIGISETAIENNIAKLKKKGLLKRIGPDKGGYWEIIGKKK